MYFAFAFPILLVTSKYVYAKQIEVLKCEPPDFPELGSYGPLKESYTPGDTIHYYCNTDTFIGGNYLGLCLDSGDWAGNTPVCDAPTKYEDVRQSSTAEPSYKNDAFLAVDGEKSTCTETELGPNQEWTARLRQLSTVIRFMLFLPRGEVAYEAYIIKADGSEFKCGENKRRMERLEWTFHNCIEPHNVGAVAIKIKSTDENIPLRLCEVVTHTLTEPTCVDPHVFVESGRMMISRKNATLVCFPGFTKSRQSSINCIRNGVWQRKLLYCLPTDIETENVGLERPAVIQTERERPAAAQNENESPC